MAAPCATFPLGARQSAAGYKRGCRCGRCRYAHLGACQGQKGTARPRVRHELLADGHLVTYPLRYVGPRWRCCGGRVVEGARCPACQTPAPWSGHGGGG